MAASALSDPAAGFPAVSDVEYSPRTRRQGLHRVPAWGSMDAEQNSERKEIAGLYERRQLRPRWLRVVNRTTYIDAREATLPRKPTGAPIAAMYRRRMIGLSSMTATRPWRHINIRARIDLLLFRTIAPRRFQAADTQSVQALRLAICGLEHSWMRTARCTNLRCAAVEVGIARSAQRVGGLPDIAQLWLASQSQFSKIDDRHQPATGAICARAFPDSVARLN